MSSNLPDPMPRPKHSVLMVVVGLAATAVIVGLVYSIVLSASNSQKINDRQRDAIATIDNTELILTQIEDCITPGQECYDQGQRQIDGAVDNVNLVVVLAATCASGSETRDELYIQQCVLDALANRKKHNK